MSSWQTLSSEEVYKTPWIRVRRDEVLNHNGKQLTYSVIELLHPSVFIVAANAAGQIYLQQNYRYPLDKTMLELPAGYADEDDRLVAAKRELLEETGLTSDSWVELGTLYQANGIGVIPFTAFLARDVQKSRDISEQDEELGDQRFIDLDEVEHMIANHELIESAHISAIYLAKLFMNKGRNNT